MKVLMLGGTRFVGPAVVEAARARGHEVTVFNRGSRQPPPGVTALRGDRTAEGGLAALADGDGVWDVVVDAWSGAPRAVRDTARLLAGRAGRYVYVSSRSVYAWPMPAGLAEDGPVVESSPDAEHTEYAEDKRGGELAAEAAFGERSEMGVPPAEGWGRALLARCGLILGPGEDVGRLPWWLERIARGGRVMAPGPPELPLQYVDVRDLAEWLLDAAERGLGGPYDVVSASGHATMGGLLDACVEATGSDAELCWTEPEAVLAAGIEPWTQAPVWTPPGSELHDALHRSDASKALAAGLRCRTVGETVADTWAWVKLLNGRSPRDPELPPLGITPEAEARALAG